MGMGFPACCLDGALYRFCYQDTGLSLSHLATRRARGSADCDLGDPGRCPAKDGHLRHPAGQFPHASPRHSRPPLLFFFFFCVGGLEIFSRGPLGAMAQKDLKKLVAYSSVSHMGYVMLSMATFTPQGISGAVLQMFNHGTITG